MKFFVERVVGFKAYVLTKNWSFGYDYGFSGTYYFFSIWSRTRHRKAKEYGPGEFRFYLPKWWKTQYTKDPKTGKLKVSWQGTVIARHGGLQIFSQSK